MHCFDIPTYKIIKKISTGGFSNVYKAVYNNDMYAIKIMKKNNNTLFENEYNILSQISHPYICKCIEHVILHSKNSIVLEFIHGIELYYVLYVNGVMTYTETKFISACILSALIYLHDKNIIYRDVKPENIIINSNGYAILVDFGFAKKLSTKYTYTFCGTLEYMAPEIKQKKPYTISIDMYSFGILVCEMFTGKVVYSSSHEYPFDIALCLSNLISDNSFSRKTANALRWSYLYGDMDFELLEKYKIESPYKTKINLMLAARM